MATKREPKKAQSIKDETTFHDRGTDDPRDAEQEEVNRMAAAGALPSGAIETVMNEGQDEGTGSRTTEKRTAAEEAVAADEHGDKPAHHAAEARMEQAEMEEELEDIRAYTTRIKQSVMHHQEMAKFHNEAANKLIETAREEGVNINFDADDEEPQQDRGRRRRRHGRGQVTSPDDKRLKGNETPALAAARANEQDDDRGQVKDPAHDKRLKKNQ